MEWIQEALDKLADAWVNADPTARQAITDATHVLDQSLQEAPELQGESRGDGERVVFAYPLAVRVEIDRPHGVVWVLHVWRFRRRGE